MLVFSESSKHQPFLPGVYQQGSPAVEQYERKWRNKRAMNDTSREVPDRHVDEDPRRDRQEHNDPAGQHARRPNCDTPTEDVGRKPRLGLNQGEGVTCKPDADLLKFLDHRAEIAERSGRARRRARVRGPAFLRCCGFGFRHRLS